MSQVAVVTDSTSSLPQELIDRYSLRVAPQVLIWGTDNLLDGIDITAEQFYERLQTTDVMPTTSQATVANFKDIFADHIAEGRDIVAVVLSHKLSGTYQSAIQAKAMFPEARIEVVDTGTVAMALGFHALAAARVAENGGSVADTVAVAREDPENVGLILMLDTLEFLHRGGRIGAAQRLLGTALSMKPILEIADGEVVPLDRVRTRSKATARILQVFGERVGEKRPLRVAVHHTGAPEDAEEVARVIKDEYGPDELVQCVIGPVVGVHAGPGAVAIAYMTGT
jgi:DegV family protein with EDD domain